MKIVARIALLAGSVLCGCSKPVEDAHLPTVRVENGVRIVENQTLTADSIAWTFDSVPRAVIGEAEGSPEYLIGRLAGYLRAADGSILVASGISQTIRRYSATGRFIETRGGAGDGPGEYRVLSTIVPYRGDSVLAVDHEGRRLTVLDRSLRFTRSQRVRLQDGRADSHYTSDGVADIGGSGELLMYDYLNVCGPEEMSGFCEDSMTLFRTDMSGVPVARYGKFVYWRNESRIVGPRRLVGWGEPHPQVFRRMQGDRMYYADARRFEILIYNAKGALETVIRAPYINHRYSLAELVPRERADMDSAARATRRIMKDALSAGPVPDSLPQFSDLELDESGNIWVAEYVAPGRADAGWPRWYVFSPDGILIHIVRTPPEFKRPAVPWLSSHPQIGADFGLVARRDDDGIDYVVLYGLRKR